MKSFLQFIAETKKLSWITNPKIGWWKDTVPLIMYHGTHISNVESISSTGLFAPTTGPTADWVSLAFDPNTAFGYASMSGGEAAFRAAGAKPKFTKPEDRAVLVLKFKNGFKDLVKLHYDDKLGGNLSKQREHLLSKEIYDQFDGPDQQYYQLSEIRIPKKLDKKYIIGYTKKN